MGLALASLLLRPSQEQGGLLKALRTPTPFSVQDEQIRARRERVLRTAQRDPQGGFGPLLARAQATKSPADFVLVVAVGFEAFPNVVSQTSREYVELIRALKACDPGKSLEIRRSAYLMRAMDTLAPMTESIEADPNGRIRRALLNAYPNDPQVWLEAARETMFVSRFVGAEDARRIASWWDRWHPDRQSPVPVRYATYAQLQAWLGVASFTKSIQDARRAEGFYLRWSKLAQGTEKERLGFYGRAVRGASRLAGAS